MKDVARKFNNDKIRLFSRAWLCGTDYSSNLSQEKDRKISVI